MESLSEMKAFDISEIGCEVSLSPRPKGMSKLFITILMMVVPAIANVRIEPVSLPI